MCAAPCSSGEARLAGGNVAIEGRVEVCVNSEWVTVCDVSWDSVDAGVICGQLGYLQSGQ